jgi:hypothetical protein
MYAAIQTEEDSHKILYLHNSYAVLCEMVFIEETEPCMIVPVDDIGIFLRNLRNVSSDGLFEILTDLGQEFESDDNESYEQERVRLAQEIFDNMSSKILSVNGFELSQQVLWKDNNAKDKPCKFKPGGFIPTLC